MTSCNIHNYENFDPRIINYKDPEKLDNNIFMADLILNKNERLLFQTPVMKIFKKPVIDIRNNLCVLSLQFSVDDRIFFEFIENIDNYNKDFIYKNSEEWFHNTFSRKSISEFYDSCINKYYPEENNSDLEIPYIDIEIPVVNGEIDINIYDPNKKLLTISDLKKDMYICSIIELKGLKFLKKQLVTNWNIIQIKVEQNNINLTNYLINNQKEEPYHNYQHYNKNVFDEDIVEQLATYTPHNEYDDYDNICQQRVPELIEKNEINKNTQVEKKLDLKLSEIEKEFIRNSDDEFENSNVELSNSDDKLQAINHEILNSNNNSNNSNINLDNNSDDNINNSNQSAEDIIFSNMNKSSKTKTRQNLKKSQQNKHFKNIENKRKEIRKLLSEAENANRYVESISSNLKKKYSEIESMSRLL